MPNKNLKKAPAGVPQGMVTRADIVYKPESYRDSDNSVEFTLATEAPARVWDWERFDVIKEIIAADGVVIPKNGQVPLVDSHDRSTIENILGSVREIRVEGEEVVGRLYFASSESAQRALAMIREGHLDSGSVGYEQVESIWIPEKESLVHNNRSFEGPVLLTRKWALKEFSLVAIGADPYAKAREEVKPVILSREAVEETFKEKEPMENINKPVEQPQTVDIEAIKREAVAAEATRAAKITELCTRHNCPEMAAEFIRTSANIESVQDKILDTLATKTTSSTVARVEMGATDSEKFRAAAVDGLLTRAGISLTQKAAGSEAFQNVGFKGLARECLRRAGVANAGLMTDSQVFEHVCRAGMMGSDDFGIVLDAAANKAMTRGVATAQQAWKQVFRKGVLPNLERATRVNLDDAPDMLATPEGDEIKHGIVGNKGEYIQAITYARKITITRRALLADDVGVFNSLFAKFGSRAGNKIDALAFDIISSNPLMADGENIFEKVATVPARGSNLATTAAVVGSSTVDIGYQAIMKQTGSNGSKLGIVPRYLVVGPKNRVAAHILTTSMQDTTASSNANGGSNAFSDLVAITTPHFGNEWLMAADPNSADTIEVAFLDGKETPTIYEVSNNGDILGKTWVAYLDVGASALDFRGMFKNDGA